MIPSEKVAQHKNINDGTHAQHMVRTPAQRTSVHQTSSTDGGCARAERGAYACAQHEHPNHQALIVANEFALPRGITLRGCAAPQGGWFANVVTRFR